MRHVYTSVKSPNVVPFHMFITPNPDFKITVYLQVEYLKNGAFGDKVTKEH